MWRLRYSLYIDNPSLTDYHGSYATASGTIWIMWLLKHKI